eukprot:TRINITY_DN3393_c0_g1_i1.p1 TRINITY_DN3393_c0_g1~~TRINITY_DN3393_c0_g1_i1.p1  ORF type:complete len:352 (+),score=72.65 TRINITY_DN3393_c0_g1_i1:60-1115(+)
MKSLDWSILLTVLLLLFSGYWYYFTNDDLFCLIGKTEKPLITYDPVTGFGVLFEVDKVIYRTRSQYQNISVMFSEFFGNILVIDDDLMFTDRDESHYHEMIVHVPFAYIDEPENVLIIGGGDGGAVKEILKYESVKNIIVVDIDITVTEVCDKYFPYLSQSLKHDKVTHITSPAEVWIRENFEQYGNFFDVIIIDSTEFGNADPLFTTEFYEDCNKLLDENGVLVRNIGAPSIAPHVMRSQRDNLTEVFDNVHFYIASIPTFFTGDYAFSLSSQKVHPLKSEMFMDQFDMDTMSTKYFNWETHKRSFVLPQYLKFSFEELPYSTEEMLEWLMGVEVDDGEIENDNESDNDI